MPDIVIDRNGIIRHCGTLPTPVGKVCSLPPFGAGASQPIWLEDVIKAVVTDKDRQKSSALFGVEWIMDQQSTSACNAYAIAACATRIRFDRGILDKKKFSGAFGYAQIKQEGSDSGSIIIDDIELSQKFGFLPLERGPWNKINRRDYTQDDYAEAAKRKGLQAYRLTSLAALQTALANRWPCVVAVMAGGSFSKLDSKGVCGLDPGMGNHAVCLDDLIWDGKRWLYDMANSWGRDFGQDGRGYLTDAHFRQTMGPHEFVCLPSFNELTE